MDEHDYELRVEDVKARAHGRWDEILRNLGVDERILRRKNMACPLCGGTDRFQYTDRFGEGNYHCRNRDCGPGGGLKLLQAVKGWDFVTTLQKVSECVGGLPAVRAQRNAPVSDERMRQLARRIWDEAMPVTRGDEVDRYLCGRGLGLDVYPAALRFHPRLGYYERDGSGKSRKVAEYAAMLARIDGPDGQLLSLHRTYLHNGRRANLADAKKVLSSGINGGAIRLFEPTDTLAVGEGIETSLAVRLLKNLPVWGGLSAGNLERLWLPDTVRHVLIFGDNDTNADFDGQASAYALARRIRKEARHGIEREVEVHIPRKPGADWADVWWSVVRSMKRSA
ncbi:MAG: toprim domain-containing protein [Acidovorax sp.]